MFFINGFGLYKKYYKATEFNIFELFNRYKALLIPLIIPIILYFIICILVDGGFVVKRFFNHGYNLILPYTWFIITLLLLQFIFFVVWHICDSCKSKASTKMSQYITNMAKVLCIKNLEPGGVIR